MNHQEQNDCSSALSPSNFSIKHMPSATKHQIYKDSCEVLRAVDRKNTIENSMSLITNTAMTNSAMTNSAMTNSANLLQQKPDLDAGAFATRKAMLDEFLRHR